MTLSATVGPVDLVLDMNMIFGLVELTQLLPKSTQQRLKAPMKIPLLHLELQDTAVFFPVESYERLDDIFCISLQNFNLSQQPENQLRRLVISTSVYQSAQASGLLTAPGEPLEDNQSA